MWKKFACNFEREIVEEELTGKLSQLQLLKEEFTNNLRYLRETCSVFKCVVIIKIRRSLQRTLFQVFHQETFSIKIQGHWHRRTHQQHFVMSFIFLWKANPIQRSQIFSSSALLQQRYSSQLWKTFLGLDSLTKDLRKKLAFATLRSIALNYITKKGPTPSKALLRALKNLKRRDDIVIPWPDKGSSVVVMDRDQYLRLLSEASINDPTKFAHIDQHRPKKQRKTSKTFPSTLTKRKKQLHEKIHKILPKATAEQLCPKGSRLAHLYGLPKTHKDCAWDPSYQPRARTTTRWRNGWMKNPVINQQILYHRYFWFYCQKKH